MICRGDQASSVYCRRIIVHSSSFRRKLEPRCLPDVRIVMRGRLLDPRMTKTPNYYNSLDK